MSILKAYISNPIFFFTFTGLGILLGMFVFFGWFFWHKTNEAVKEMENKANS